MTPGYTPFEVSESSFFSISGQLAQNYSFPQAAQKTSAFPRENKRNSILDRMNKKLAAVEANILKNVIGSDKSPLRE